MLKKKEVCLQLQSLFFEQLDSKLSWEIKVQLYIRLRRQLNHLFEHVNMPTMDEIYGE